jgi:hypothetical protein
VYTAFGVVRSSSATSATVNRYGSEGAALIGSLGSSPSASRPLATSLEFRHGVAQRIEERGRTAQER